MFAANQLGLFSQDKNVQEIQRLTTAEPASRARSVRAGSGSFGKGLRVDTAFERAQRFVLEVNGERTCLVPVAANDACLEPESSWVEHVPQWLTPDRPLFEALLSDCNWQSSRRVMYDRVVDVPRMLAHPPSGARSTTLLQALAKLLSARYSKSLLTSSLALYRDGNDSVAPHGDKLGELIGDTVVGILSLGHARVMRLRPNSSQRGLSSIDFTLGGGDLFVMGGRCQADWLHAIPKLSGVGARISVMYREVPRTLTSVGHQERAPEFEATKAKRVRLV